VCAADELRYSIPANLTEGPLGVTVTEASIRHCEESEALVTASRLREVLEGAVALDGSSRGFPWSTSSAFSFAITRPLAKADCLGTATNNIPADLIEGPLGVTLTEASIWYCGESEALVEASRLQEVLEGAIALDGSFRSSRGPPVVPFPSPLRATSQTRLSWYRNKLKTSA
jgi:hypothetical protein